MDALTVRPGSVTEPGVAALIAQHFELMRSSSPEESCHVMPADALEKEGAAVFVAQEGDVVLGVGAIKEIEPAHGEIKSMHTSKAARGRGIGRLVLQSLISYANEQNMQRLSLETGTAEMFAPARALYSAHGFEDCPPFGDYTLDPLSVFMTRAL